MPKLKSNALPKYGIWCLPGDNVGILPYVGIKITDRMEIFLGSTWGYCAVDSGPKEACPCELNVPMSFMLSIHIQQSYL